MLNFIQNLFGLPVWICPKPEPKAPRVPETYEEAVQFVYERIDPETVTDPLFHFSGGMSVRNGLGLWNDESALYQHMLRRFGLCHADDTGALICNAANARKNGETYSPDADVQRFKEHWRAAGFDPATMERTQ